MTYRNAIVIAEIVRAVADDRSYRSIARSLNERSEPSPAGARWLPVTVRAIAASARYVPAIVSPELHERALAIVQARALANDRSARALLTGIMRSPCGARVKVHRRADPDRDRYLCARDGCTSAPLAETDAIAIARICERARERSEDFRSRSLDDQRALVRSLAIVKLAPADRSYLPRANTGARAEVLRARLARSVWLDSEGGFWGR